jgi:murein L,D-transpeptidase YcbB/YkuD
MRAAFLPRLAAALLVLAAALVPAAAAAGGPDSAAATAARIEQALARYRALAAAGGWATLPEGPVLEPGATDARVPLLRARLAATGDLPGAGEGARYEADLVGALRRFQARHGLLVDGRVGERTRAALNVPAAERAATLALNLERWRALPDPAGALLRVNTAAATLDLIRDGTSVLSMAAIVGKPSTPTPDFESAVTAVVFNPAWTLPRSIAAGEILPQLRRDPRHLAANEMRILERPDDPHGLGVDWSRVSRAGFPFTLRQAPGPRNPLGRIKFDVPSRYDVYLHDTPEHAWFARPERARSHGCIRLAGARELASVLLGWDAASIEAAIAAGETRRLAVAPVPLVIAYLTAFVDAAGEVHFRPDIYRRDAATRIAAAPAGCPG